MKLYNISVGNEIHLALEGVNGIIDAAAAGFGFTMDQVIAGQGMDGLKKLEKDESISPVEAPVFADVLNVPGKILCIGLNYAAHAAAVKDELCVSPTVFNKFPDSLTFSGAEIFLPPWEKSYDYEAELVAVIGKRAWNVTPAEAADCIFGYTCGNDLSLREAQKRTSQWLVGKALPGFGPCGPCIVTADCIDPKKGLSIRSYLNGELRQDGTTADMLRSCEELISYISKYIPLDPGTLLFTGTPAGVILERPQDERRWIRPGDRVDIFIEGIGTLTNTFI